MIDPLISEMITSGALVEGAGCDFKSQVDFSDPRAKSNLVDDVVAFLNAGEGRIIIGVEEKGGVFVRFRPLSGNRDETVLRAQSILQDNIKPVPLHIIVVAVEIEGGFLLDLQLPVHRMRPYQNAITGGFQIRTGVKNKVLDVASIAALSVPQATFEADLKRLAEEQEALMAHRGMMSTEGASLRISILPLEHYRRDLPPFERGQIALKGGPMFHRDSAVFRGCEGGHEATSGTFNGPELIERLFVGNTWFVHAHIVHPINVDERLKLPEFEAALRTYLTQLRDFLASEKLEGPFCTQLSVHNLDRSKYGDRAFPRAKNQSLPYPAFGEDIAAEDTIKRLYNLVVSASMYG